MVNPQSSYMHSTGAVNDPDWQTKPRIQAGEMRVKRQAPTDNPAAVRIADASQLQVTRFFTDREFATVEPKLEDASMLQYGEKHPSLEESLQPFAAGNATGGRVAWKTAGVVEI